ncbi:NADH-quinone oxidoreductase subunit M [Proteus hauseri]|uniref:NADH-quinone oxidoreductase subunit M n=1 Tax=Proteus hauseri TaxID=183417 RepID=UPI0032DA4482
MLLPWLILIPFIGGLLSWQAERIGSQIPRWVALLTMGLTLVISVQLWLQGDYHLISADGAPRWTEFYFVPWIPALGINIQFALDGMSLLMTVLTAILGILAVLSSWNENQPSQGAFHFNLLWILAGVMGVFLATDLFLFFFFWEMMLIPMYFLISLWGHKGSSDKKHVSAATKFFIYTQASGLLMLLAIIGLAVAFYRETGIWTFSYDTLLQAHTVLGSELQFILMLGFFAAFAVKMPIVPVHGWLADAHAEAPTAGSVDLSGILLKTAAYGLLRFNLPLFPEASALLAPVAMWLGLITIFYAALLAFRQTDIKRLAAYSSISHMGFIVIAIYAGSVLAYQGAIIQMITNGLSAAGLFIMCGMLYERLGTRDMNQMGGLWKSIRFLPAFSLFFAVASLGMPGTGNFVGEFMILFGTYGQFKLITIISVFGLVFASVYALWMMQQAYYGSPKTAERTYKGLDLREFIILMSLVVMLVILGFFPQPVLDTSISAMENLQTWYSASISTVRP